VLLYSLGFVLIQAGLLTLTVVLVSSPWFLTHDDYPGMLQSGYGMRLQHEDCEVLIYGDSTTLTGLDPAVVQQMTGLKTCNIAEGGTIQGVVGSRFPLDAYLSRNKRPRFLLTMYSPLLFRPDRKLLDDYKPEGMIYAFQNDRTPAFYRGLLHRREWAFDFVAFAAQRMIGYFLQHYLLGVQRNTVDTRAQRDGRRGIWPYNFPPETHCLRGPIGPNDVARYADEVASMRAHYAVQGTQVIVNIAPVPICSVSYEIYRSMSEGLHDNAFERLPISYFNEGDVHFSPEGSRYISIEAGNQILALEKRQDAQRQAAHGVAP